MKKIYISLSLMVTWIYTSGQNILEAESKKDGFRVYLEARQKYDSGDRSPVLIRELARAAKQNNLEEFAYKIANGYLDTLPDTKLYEEENVCFAGDFLKTSKDRGFNVFYNNWENVKKYIANKYFGPSIVGQIVFTENIEPFIESDNGRPDYKKIENSLAAFGETGKSIWARYHLQVFTDYDLLPFLRSYPDWYDIRSKISAEQLGAGEALAVVSVLRYYSKGIIAGNALKNLVAAVKYLDSKYSAHLTNDLMNSVAYHLFQASSDRNQLEYALSLSKRAIDKQPNPGYLDTYASLLYKLGHKQEAIDVQQKCIEQADGAIEFTLILDKMHADKQLSWDFGKQVDVTKSRVDFSGTWGIDSLNGEFSGMTAAKAAPLKLIIKQSANAIEISRGFSGSQPKAEEMGFDGKPLLLDLPETKVKRRLTWSEDKSTLTVFSTYNVSPSEGQPWEYSREETFTLMDEGKSLLLSRITIMPDKVDNVKAVYQKQ